MGTAETTLVIPHLQWWRLLHGLKRRGGGVRESGAFLLGDHRRPTPRITAIMFYDDVDPRALDSGIIRLSGHAMNKVWERCAKDAVSLLADVHTHPGGAAQSRSDRENPMSALPGHVAIIVPRFARSMFDLVSIGQYRYLGCGRWRDGTPPRLRLSGIAFGACP